MKIALPLVALRAFESFARFGNIAQAAAELGITASAVSHQLSSLETLLGVALTLRHGRKLELTDEGRRYFEAVSPAFILLHRATAQLQLDTLPRRVTISALPLLANGWLMPQLASFMQMHPDIDIQIQHARYRNYSSDASDLSLRFGLGDWPGYESEKLLSGRAYPVASPMLVTRYGPFEQAASLLAAPLVHDGTIEPWNAWLQSVGVKPPAILRGMVCEDGALTLAAMQAGIGIALTRPLLIEDELRSGQLVQLSEHGIATDEDYYLCVRSDREPLPAVKLLAAWLRVSASTPGKPRRKS